MSMHSNEPFLDETSHEMPRSSMWPPALQHGLIQGGLLLIYSITTYALGFTTPNALVNMLASVTIVASTIHFGAVQHRNALGGFVSFGRLVGLGAVISGIGHLIASIWTILLFHVINPQLLEKQRNLTIAQLEESGADEATIETSMQVMDVMMSMPAQLVMGLIGGAIWGVCVALLVGMWVSKKPR